MNRWAKSGVLNQVFSGLQHQQIIRIHIQAISLDSKAVKVHTDGTGAQKNGPQAIGESSAGWTTRIHLLATDTRMAVSFSLSPGNAGDTPVGRELLKQTTLSVEYVAWIESMKVMEHASRCLISV
jgi:hypothetical protein